MTTVVRVTSAVDSGIRHYACHALGAWGEGLTPWEAIESWYRWYEKLMMAQYREQGR